MTRYSIALMPGDGIGPEQTQATRVVLSTLEEKYGIDFEITEVEAGDSCLKNRGVALPEQTLETMRGSHAILKGPVGETAADVIVKLRMIFDLYVNLRPIKSFPKIPAVREDIDMIFVRENTEDLYKGIEFMVDSNTAVGLRVITEKGSRRIAEYAFKVARKRRQKVTAIHKSNVLRVTDTLFANTCRDVAKNYADVAYNELYVDTAAMQLIREPQNFGVLLTPNLFGDILSDEAAQLVGGLGIAPGANVGDSFALFEPIHGCAPDIAGKQTANPCSMILSAGLMLDWLGERHKDQVCVTAAKQIERAVQSCLRDGITTPDIGGSFSTQKVGEAVAQRLVET